MSDLTSVMAVSWSTVSVNPNASSISACHGVSGPNACPGAACRLAYSDTSSPAISRTARRALVLVLVQSLPPSRLSAGASPADVARQLIQRVHRHDTACPAACRPALLDAYSSTRYSRRAPPTVRSTISTNRPMPCWSCTTRSPAVSASGSTMLRRLAASRLPSVAAARLPVRSVSVMTTRFAPAARHRRATGP